MSAPWLDAIDETPEPLDWQLEDPDRGQDPPERPYPRTLERAQHHTEPRCFCGPCRERCMAPRSEPCSCAWCITEPR